MGAYWTPINTKRYSQREEQVRNRLLRLTLAPLVGSMLAGAIIAAAPAAASATPSSGYMELCKTFAAVPAGQQSYQGTFNYTVYNGSTAVAWQTIKAVTGGPQVCTQPFGVPAGVNLKVAEASNSWSSLAGVTESPGDPGTVSFTPGNSYATVNVVAGGQSTATTVQFTNDPVYGVVELCKAPAANSSMLTGTYTFNLTSDESGIKVFDSKTGAYDLPWTSTTSATISSAGLGCSGPATVPAGGLNTAEQGTALYVTGIGAKINGSTVIPPSTPVLTDSSLAAGTADVVVEAGDTTNQTIVTYTDAISTVKLCKQWNTREGVPSTMFPFTASSTGPAGPTAVTGMSSLQAGTCEILGYVRAGTAVTITEGVVAGTKVASITAPSALIVPGSLSLPNRTIQVIAGPGETDVTFTDEAADPGQLKICVQPTTGATNGTAAFIVGNAGVTTHMINVNVSSTAVQCTLDPNAYAFNSSVTLSGSVPSPDAFTGTPSVLPTNVEVWEGSPGVLTATNQPSLSASTASTATVLMSEGTVTEVTFTIDPPAPATAPTQTATPTAAQVTANSVDLPSQGSGGSQALSPAQVTAALRKQLAHVRAEIRALQHKLAKKHLSKAARRADQRRLSALRRLEPHILKELK